MQPIFSRKDFAGHKVVTFACGCQKMLQVSKEFVEKATKEECHACQRKHYAKAKEEALVDGIAYGISIKERSIAGYINQFNAPPKEKKLSPQTKELSKEVISAYETGMSFKAMVRKGWLGDIIHAIIREMIIYPHQAYFDELSTPAEKEKRKQYLLMLDALIEQSITIYQLVGDTQEHRGFVRSVGATWQEEIHGWILTKAPAPEIAQELADRYISLINPIDYAVLKSFWQGELG